MKHIMVGAISFLFLAAAAPLASAQSTASSTEPTKTGTPVAVASVSLDASATYDAPTRTIAVHAIVGSAMGDLSDAALGVALVSKNGYDASFIPERMSLVKGQSIAKDLSIQIPQDVGGDVSAYAVVSSPSGITIANQPVWSNTVKAVTSSSPFSCKSTGKSVECAVAKGTYTLVYHVYQGAPGGRERAFGFEEDTGGKTITVPKDALPAGSYAAVVRLTDPAQSFVYSAKRFDLTVPGPRGTIDTFLLEDQGRGTYLVVATAHAYSGSSTPASLSFQTLKDGIPCGAPLVATTTIVSLAYHPTCDADSVVANLIVGGTKLDTAVATIFPHPSLSAWTWPTAAMLAILIAAGLTAYAMKRRRMTPPAAPQVPTNPNPYA